MQVYGAAASPDNPRGTRAGLVLLYAPSYEQFAPAYLLSERDLILGRDPSSCQVCVPEAAVSRQHARVRWRAGQDGGSGAWVLTDLGGRNGTLVDGQYVTELELEPDHEIRVGDAIFKFVESGAESFARYRIDGAIIEPPEEAPAVQIPMPTPGTSIVGGYRIRQLTRSLERIAKSEISVVLLGESGTGKEVFAQELHRFGGRKGSFQAVNCAAIPATLLESELFGYKRGAFSGADRDKVGIVKAADGGTLFLDEIGDMPIEAQAKLLRVLQSREIVPIGATAPERVDVRIVCATHRDLAQLQADGRFRGDLYARLNEYSLRLPPLRERKEDMFLLARALLARHGKPSMTFGFPFMLGLLHYDWPFNVRELEAAIKRGVALAEGSQLESTHLPDIIKEAMREYGGRGSGATPPPHRAVMGPPGHLPTQPLPYAPQHPQHHPLGSTDIAPQHVAPSSVRPPPMRVGTPTEPELRALLQHHRGNVAAVGREFGKERMQVHRWMKKYGISPEDYR
jgi:DNA-binding NtrC family response regulator